jgi:hypothetical protein
VLEKTWIDSIAFWSRMALHFPGVLWMRSLPPRDLFLTFQNRPAARPGYRELVVPFGSGAYIIRYRIDTRRDAVVITRLWHGREQRE